MIKLCSKFFSFLKIMHLHFRKKITFKMSAILFRWCKKWRKKQLWLNLSYFQLLLLSWIIISSVLNLMVTVTAQEEDTETSASNTNNRNETESGSWEYYYEDEEDPQNSTSVNSNSKSIKNKNDKFPNSTEKNADEFYYYLDEEVVEKPNNGSGTKKVIKTTTLKVQGRNPHKNSLHVLRGDSFKSGSHPFLEGIRGGGGFENGLVALPPSVEPFKQLATPIDVEGPVYTDYNYGPQYYRQNYQHDGQDTAVGKPLGPGEFPPDPFKPEVDPVLLRPPPQKENEQYTQQPPAESGLDLDVVKHVEFIDGPSVPSSDYNNYNDDGHHSYDNGGGGTVDVGVIGEDVKSSVYDDDRKNNDNHNHVKSVKPNLLSNLHTQLKVEAYGNLLPEKNPIVKAKEFFVALWDIIINFTKEELVLWTEKGLNLVAELTIPQEHYIRVISFVGIYLFMATLTYSSGGILDLVCAVENYDAPIKRWKYHAARRYVPGLSVDPKMQKRFLKLFRGKVKEEDEEEEEDDLVQDDTSGSSSEEDIADEMEHISELCPENAFFYSLNPRHIEAYTIIQRMLVAQDTPKKFLKLAKRLLIKEKVHPKVWYFGVIAAFLERQDLTGFSVAHPLDAIPDWYIPADLIEKIVKRYKKIRVRRSPKYTIKHKRQGKGDQMTKYNYTVSGMSNAFASIQFSEEDDSSFSSELPLKLPVKGEKGNYTVVTIVTSKKTKDKSVKEKDGGTATSESSSSSPPPPSSEEGSDSSSTSTEPKDEEKIKEKVQTLQKINSGEDKKKEADDNVNPIVVIVEHQVPLTSGGKGDKGELILKGRPSKLNGTLNEYLIDKSVKNATDSVNDNHSRRRNKKGKKKKKCIKVNWKVGLDNGIENELWYWREDMMLNQHHWWWHQTHAVNATFHADRRAELFFYMHRSLVARYNAERLSNGLDIVKPLKFRDGEVITSGYNSHLADINSMTYWTPRWPHTPLADIHHEHDPDFASNITLSYYDQLCQRLISAIKSGKLIPVNSLPIPINHKKGIDLLANTIEASDLSVNPMFYDPMGIHALGHIMVGLASDPDFRFRKVTGVMSDAAVSMRDPSFYAYHLFMDNIFELHKERLPPYEVVGGEFPLLWKGVQISSVEIITLGGAPKNELRTFWSQHKFDLSPGVDRAIGKGKEKTGRRRHKHKFKQVCAHHLDHQPFYFKIVIDRQPCVKSKSNLGTVRIFMAPRYDRQGKRIPVKVQRRMMFPLDAFSVKLRVGRNTITRHAEDSSLTQPWTKSFRDYERGPDPSGAADFCGCGFPQHLYIPKGHTSGMAFDLFVMVTNHDQDYVPNDPKILEVPETCNSPYIFCGLPRRRYPDRRPMGYPFDRPLFKSFNCPPGWTFGSVICKSANLVLNRPIDTLEEYVSRAPNMAMLKVHVRHINDFLPEPARH